MKEFELSGKLGSGLIATVDDEDLETVLKYKWYPMIRVGTTYARTGRVIGESHKSVLLHRLILGLTDPKIIVDHKDHNGLNCRKNNLRICTSSENNSNCFPQIGRSSKYKGVSWHKSTKKWIAKIRKDKKDIHLGVFEIEIHAAIAYDSAAKVLFGKYAYLNFQRAPFASYK